MKKLLTFALFALLMPAAVAQFTTVTGTVVDPNGLPYAFGTISATLVSSASPTLNGFPYSPPTQPVGLDKNGSFSFNVADNTQLSPAATKWNFQVCSAVGTVNPAIGTGSQCFTLGAPITISGASQSISTQLNAVATALTVPGIAGAVVSVGGTAPIVSTGGVNPVISCPTCSTATINPTNGTMPVRSAATTFADSPLTVTANSLLKTNVVGTVANPTGLWINNVPPFGGLSVGTFGPGNDAVEDYVLLLDTSFTDTTFNKHYGLWTLMTGNTAAGNIYANFEQTTVTGSSNFTTGGPFTYANNLSTQVWSNTNAAGISKLEGYDFTVNASAGSGPPATIAGITLAISSSSTGTTATQVGLNIQNTVSAAATTVTNNYGVRIQSPVGFSASSFTHNYGVRTEDQSVVNAGTDSWSFYAAGGKSFFRDGLVQSNCAAVGSAANPSVAACAANVTGAVSCATNASTGTCQVNTTAVTASSIINVQQRVDTATGTRLSVTCNTNVTTTLPAITAISVGASFTFQLGTFAANPECFTYSIESLS